MFNMGSNNWEMVDIAARRVKNFTKKRPSLSILLAVVVGYLLSYTPPVLMMLLLVSFFALLFLEDFDV